jgi:hypothetical protein
MSSEAEQAVSPPSNNTCSPEVLRTLFLFENLEEEQLRWLCAQGTRRKLPRQKSVLRR